MALNVTESHAVNVIVSWLLQLDEYPPPPAGEPTYDPPSNEMAAAALERLVTAANKRLSAGWRPEQVRKLFWKRLRETRQTELPLEQR